ncbi:unnamed protein product [Ectocarpus sp. CCAP 1310/34]|nr:unnamed protein product [Ectocarpus sp. CCAP 1310/34]
MALRNRKLAVRANLSCFDLITILESVRTQCPKLIYLGIWYRDGFVYVYAQGAERMSDIMLAKALEGHIVFTDISTFDAPISEPQEEWRAKPVCGNKKIEVKANTTAVFVHPLGKESLQHATSDFIADLLRPLPGIDVFNKFGLKLYSLHQNINFRVRKGDKNARVCCSRKGWITVPREEAYDEILQILVKKTREAVSIILAYKDSAFPEQRKLYERRRILNNIAVSVTDNMRRMSGWSDKKRKLVYKAPPKHARRTSQSSTQII